MKYVALLQLEDTKQSLQRALSEKDIAQHQSEKHQQKCEELKLEVRVQPFLL